MRASAFRTCTGHFLCNHDFAAFVTVVCGNSVSPPKLTGNTPVLDIVGPVKIGLLHSFRNQLDFAFLYCLDSGLDQFIHFYKPLLLYKRLYGCLAAVMGSYVMNMVFNLNKKSHFIQFFNNGISCGITIHACKLAAVFVNCRIIVHDVDKRKVIALSY